MLSYGGGGHENAGTCQVDNARAAAVLGMEVALDFAIAAASQPNGVTEQMFADMRKHWNETQIVEIAAVVAVFGFLNRWNDTMGTPLEAEPIEVGEKYLAKRGWSVGKHAR